MTITDRALDERFAPVFARIAEGALERERERRLPFAEIELLREAGLPGIRVPAEFGGLGATLPQAFRVLVELAAADPHLPQALRGHVAYVEDRLWAAPDAVRDGLLCRFAAGDIVGNAWTEVGGVALGAIETRVTPSADGAFTVSGSKYYTTGSIFADWIDATASLADGTEVTALVATGSDAVHVSDDWDGFGQRLTGSGTAVFDDAPVRAGHVAPFAERFPFQTALYQLVLVAVQAGIARAAADDAAAHLAGRTRAYSTGNAPSARHDPQLLEVVGRLEANAFAVAAVADRTAHALQAVIDARGDDHEAFAVRRREAELASAAAQLTANRLATESGTLLFDALGASATSTQLGLDRHWRNARTVASHNPQVYKARILGDAAVNGTEPPFDWAVGVPASAAESAPASTPVAVR